MNSCKIGMIQTLVEPEKQKNLDAAAALICTAASDGADFVVLPEMFDCPYKTDNFPVYAEPDGGSVYTQLAAMARNAGVYLIAGTVPERDGDQIYNTCYIFNRQGEQIAKHRKMHLFNISIPGKQAFRESDTLSAGNQVTVFDTEFGKMGAAICYDIRFPELYRLMALAGAQIIFTPAAFSMTTGRAHWELAFRSRALDNQVFTVGVAPARSHSGGYTSYSKSIIADPWGSIAAQMDETPGYLVTSIDLAEITRIRSQLPLLAQRRTDLYDVIKK